MFLPDLVEPFCNDRKEVAAGDGNLSCSESLEPSYRGVSSDRDNRGVFSCDCSECLESFDVGRSLSVSNGEEGLSDMLRDK